MEHSPSEKLTGSHLVKKFPDLMETKISLAHLQVPVICPYPDPDQCSPCHPNQFLKMHLNIILLSKPGFSK